MSRLGTVLFGAAAIAILVAERRYARRPKEGVTRSNEGAKTTKEEKRFARSAPTSSSLRPFVASRETPSSLRRLIRNAAMGIMAMAVVDTIERPMMEALTRRRGKTHPILAFLLLDYSMYLWHVATHRVPALWRLHRVHHIDPALDASTALRFHMLDMVVSLPLRAAQALLIQPTPATFEVWQRFFVLSVLFHHSNIRLAPELERRLALVLTTPTMHDIHHSQTEDRTQSNWSSGLSIWDRLHGTFRLDPDLAVPIGVPAFAPHKAALEPSLRLPFAPRRDDWSPA